MQLLFLFSCIIWLCSEIFLTLFFRAKVANATIEDKSTLKLLWITISLSIGLSVYISNKTLHTFYETALFSYLGVGLILAGVLLRLAVVKSLGSSFTVNVAVRANQKLTTTGFFKNVRHPSYSFSILSFGGLALVLNNWISFLVLIIPIVIAFSYRIKIEEDALIEEFGEEYLVYKKRTKKLIPFLY